MTRLAQYLTPEEVAARLGLHRKTVLGMVNAGRLPGCVRLGPKVIRIPEAAVIQLLQQSPAVWS